VTQARGRSGPTIQLAPDQVEGRLYDNLGRVKTKTVKDPVGQTVNTIRYK
jgi:hypothetical protein